MSKLYELDIRMLGLFDALDVYDYEETDAEDIERLFDEFDRERSVKLENIGLYIRELTGNVEVIKAEEERLKLKRKAEEGRINWLKGYALRSVQALGAVKTPLIHLSARRSEVLDIAEGCQVPSEYMRVKTIHEPDKTALKQAIKEGELIDGVSIRENYSLQIR